MSPSAPAPSADGVRRLGLASYIGLSIFSVALIPAGLVPGLPLLRAAPTVLLAYLALRSTRRAFGSAIAWGLLLGAAGDAFLNTFDPDLAPFGVVAFFAGHLAYIRGMRRGGWQVTPARRWGVAALLAFGLAYAAVILWFDPTQPLRRIAWVALDPPLAAVPVAPALLGYMPALIGMASVALLRRGSRLLAAGAAVFVASDALIPLNQFLLPKADGAPWASEGLLFAGFTTYYAAQYLIARGAMADEDSLGAAP